MLDEECLSSGPVGLATFARGLLCDPGLTGLARGLLRVETGETLVPAGPVQKVPSKFSTDYHRLQYYYFIVYSSSIFLRACTLI